MSYDISNYESRIPEHSYSSRFRNNENLRNGHERDLSVGGKNGNKMEHGSRKLFLSNDFLHLDRSNSTGRFSCIATRSLECSIQYALQIQLGVGEEDGRRLTMDMRLYMLDRTF